MSFTRELTRNTFQSNIILKIDGVYYSQYQTDCYDLIETDKIDLVVNLSLSPSQVNFTEARSSIANLNFTLLDKDLIISQTINSDKFAWLGKKVEFYYGYITGNFSFAEYRLLSTTYVRSISKKENAYDIKAEEPQSFLKNKRIYTTLTTTTQVFLVGETGHIHADTTGFPSSGMIFSEGEYITYSSKTSTQFNLTARAQLGSEARAGDAGQFIFNVTTLQGHPMDLAKNLIVANVPTGMVNTGQFDNLKTTTFNAEPDYKFYMVDIADALVWLEENILIATNTRLTTDGDGKISIRLLDVLSDSSTADTFSEDFQIGMPSYVLDTTEIVNQVVIQTDYQPGSGKFLRIQTFTDADSIAQFGTKELVLEFKGVYTLTTASSNPIDSSNIIANNRAGRILIRLAYPRAIIETTTFMAKYDNECGDQVWFKSRFLNQPYGKHGNFNNLLEIASKSVTNFTDNAQIKWKLIFTSYSFARVGLIQPIRTPIVTKPSSSSATIASTQIANYFIGDSIALYNPTTDIFEGDHTITDIVNNKISFTPACDMFFIHTGYYIQYSAYDLQSTRQQDRYASIAPNTNIFVSDSSAAYEIII